MTDDARALVRRCAPFLAAVALSAAAPGTVRAQIVLTDSERLDFDRPESWAMKYFTSVALLTGLGVPYERPPGAVEVGIEAGQVPQLSEQQRRIGFDGTKLDDVNKTRAFGRLRAAVGLGRRLALELAYTPPIGVGRTRPNILAAALGRPFDLSSAWRLGVRAHGQIGRIDGDLTCSAREVAAGADPDANPYLCVRPSHDEVRQQVVGLELVAGYDGRSRYKPYAGVGVDHMHLEFQTDALYSLGHVEDHTFQVASGVTAFATAGLTVAATERLRVTAELFYSPLRVARPEIAGAADDGLLNARLLVSYRLR